MAGWKTYTGAALFALPGVGQVATALLHASTGHALDLQSVTDGITMVGAALAVAGLGHKADKAATSIASAYHDAAQVAAQGRGNVKPLKPHR